MVGGVLGHYHMVPETPLYGHVVSGNEINSGRAEEETVIER